MITAIQNFFLKHNKWLFGSLLVVIIVTFVLTIGPQSFFGSNSSGKIDSINYYGYDLTSDQDRRAMTYTAEISAILHPELQLSQQQLTDYAYMRVAGLGIARQLSIPEPTKDQLSDYVETLLIFADPSTGEFSAETYNRMLQLLQVNGQFNRDAIARTMREDYVIGKVLEILAGPDYSQPFELRRSYIDQETEYTVKLAHFDYVSFSPEIEVSEDALKQYYNENPSRYEVPERLTVDALKFKASNYLDSVDEPSEGELELFFSTNRFRYQPEDNAGDASETTEQQEITLADVREEVVADWKSEQARKIAAQKAQQFSLSLYQNKIPMGSPAFDKLVKELGATTSIVPSYSRNNLPVGTDLPANLLRSMWVYAVNPNRYYSDAAQTTDGAVVLVKRQLTEARMPEFEEVRELARQDYEAIEKRRLFAEKGKELSEEINSRLESESLAEIAESLRLTIEDLGQFKGTEVPEPLQQAELWDQTLSLPEGSVSQMVINDNKGTFSYVVEKDVPDLDTSSEAYTEFVDRRLGALSDAMGWARLREIKDKSIAALLGTPEVPQQ